MLVLFFGSPTIHYRQSYADDGLTPVTVTCSSVAGFGESHYYASELGNVRSYQQRFDSDHDLPSAETLLGQPYPDPFFAERQIDAACTDRRGYRTGILGLLAVPTAVLAAFAVLDRRRTPAAPPTTPATL